MEKNNNTGKKYIFSSLGASNHTEQEREENDYYATEPKALELLLDLETFDQNIWEPACGEGALSNVLVERGFNVKNTDLIDRGLGEQLDFLSSENNTPFKGDIITNPPYKIAEKFVEKALELIEPGNKVAMFLSILFVEGKKRKIFLEKNKIKTIWVSSSRLNCAKNGDWETYKPGVSARCYAWFIWEKGYDGETTLKWFN